MIAWIRRTLLRARAAKRWFRRNPSLRLAKLAARHKPVRAVALVTQSLWLTPDRLAAMRPMRRVGYVLGCLGVATGLWADVAMNLSPEVFAVGAQRLGEIGQATGWWRPEHGGPVLFILFQLIGGFIVVMAAAYARLDLGVARLLSRLVKIPPPRKVGYRYFLLLLTGDIATLFALTWVILKAASPSGLAMLRWVDGHPWAGAPLFAFVVLAYGGGFVLWQLTLRERGRQIYGEGRRPLAYSAVSVAISMGTLTGLCVLPVLLR